MSNENNENAIKILNDYISSNAGEDSLAAELILQFCESKKENWEVINKNAGHLIPSSTFSLNSLPKRVSFASQQILKLYSLTFALQARIFASPDKIWYQANDGSFKTSTASKLKEDKMDDKKINKTDINNIRKFYGNQLTTVMPALSHSLYISFLAARATYSYVETEVRLCFMDSDYVGYALEACRGFVDSMNYGDIETAQRQFLYENWFYYSKKTSRSKEKFGPHLTKLLNSTCARMTRRLTVEAEKYAEERQNSEEIIYQLLHALDIHLDIKTQGIVGKIYNAFKTSWANACLKIQNSGDHSDASYLLCLLSNVASSTFCDCNHSLVHLETISNFDTLKAQKLKSQSQVKENFTIVSEKNFKRDLELVLAGEDGNTLGSDRLNNSIYKAISANNVQTKNIASETRRRLPLDLEFYICEADRFRNAVIKLTAIHKEVKGTSMIISADTLERMSDLEFASQLQRDERIRDDDRRDHFGVLQRGIMSLGAVAKIRENDVVKSLESVMPYAQHTHLHQRFQKAINGVSLVFYSYYHAVTASPVQESSSPAKRETHQPPASSSPKQGRTLLKNKLQQAAQSSETKARPASSSVKRESDTEETAASPKKEQKKGVSNLLKERLARK